MISEKSIATLTADPRRSYRWAALNIKEWFQSRPFNATEAQNYIEHCQERGLKPSSVGTIRTILRGCAHIQYTDKAIPPEEYIAIHEISVSRPFKLGFHPGKTLIEEFVNLPDPHTLKGKRDQALLPLGFINLSSTDQADLRVEDLPNISPEGHPKIEKWLRAADIHEGYVFRRMTKGDKLTADKLSREAVWSTYIHYSAMLGKDIYITPQVANRSYRLQMRPKPVRLIP